MQRIIDFGVPRVPSSSQFLRRLLTCAIPTGDAGAA